MKKKPAPKKFGKKAPFKSKGGKRPEIMDKEALSAGHSYGTNGNDVSWDTKYPQLVKAASSLIFNQRYGFNYETIENLPAVITGRSNAIPGVVGLTFRQLLASKGTDADPINVCSKNLYSYIRHANSGSANYESSDLMQYVIAVLGIATELEQCKRDLRLVLTYSPINQYVYRAILLNRGYTMTQINDMMTNHAVYTGYINAIIAKLNTFKIPKEFSVFDRFAWMVTNIFKDDNLNKATYYYYNTLDRVHYDWANRKIVDSMINLSSYVTFGAYLDSINAEIDNLLAYEDIGIMTGDILKAYKQEGCRVWSGMNLGEVQDASESLEVLFQIQNTTTYAVTENIEITQVSANSQLLQLDQKVSNATVAAAKTYGQLITLQASNKNDTDTWDYNNCTFNPLLVMNSDEPNSEDLITSTRGTVGSKFVYINDGSTSNSYSLINDYFLYIVCQITITRKESNGTFLNWTTQTLLQYPDDTVENRRQNTIYKLLRQITCAPTLYRIFDNADVDVHTTGKNNQTVSPTWLARLHEACTMSELSLPMFKLLESN
nr:putative capsid protein [Picobirnavirus sp.]